MKIPLKASDWNGMMMALYAFASPGAGPFLAVAPTVGLIGAWLAHFRRFAP